MPGLQCYYNLSAAVSLFAEKRFETNEGRMTEYGNEEESLLSWFFVFCFCFFNVNVAFVLGCLAAGCDFSFSLLLPDNTI